MAFICDPRVRGGLHHPDPVSLVEKPAKICFSFKGFLKMAAERVEDLRIFVSAAAAGSFSAAARELGLTPAVASAAVKRLEGALGVRLFVRSTRSLRLTVEGERYRDHAHAALAALAAGRGSVQRDRHSISGKLSLSMPSDLGRHMLLPWLDDFQREHAGIRLQIRISDRLTDLHRQGVDIAIRYGDPGDSTMIALPLAPDNRRVLCAAPEYFARRGMPRVPEDLHNHNCLTFMLSDAPHDRWRFERDGKHTDVAVEG
ncbi:LysR family transcriptional regulator [Bordetella holmesii]|nr:bacterial regulatory helix-turn-helix, lysR family protein [Bordetella holmesii ATCC 51541]